MMDIKAKDLSVRFDDKFVLNKLSFTIPSGAFVAIIGPNGSGKSTLLKLLAGFVNFDGDLFFNSQRSQGILKDNVALAYVPQNLAIPVGMTVAEYVMLGRTSHSNWFFGEKKQDYIAVEKALRRLNLFSMSNQLVTTLSGGEMQRATLARALAQEAQFLLLDEPTAAMDFARVIESVKLLDKLKSQYKFTVLMATHDINSLSRYADFALVLKEGCKLYSGEFSGILNEDFLGKLYDTKIDFFKNEAGIPMIFAAHDSGLQEA